MGYYIGKCSAALLSFPHVGVAVAASGTVADVALHSPFCSGHVGGTGIEVLPKATAASCHAQLTQLAVLS